MSSPLTFLITGCSSGLGYCLALLALRAGHKVLATRRNPSTTPSSISTSISSLGGTWLTLDTTSADLESTLSSAITTHGPIDVLINNAGYGLSGTLEDTPLPEARRIMDTNFFGPLRATRAVLPSMRARGSGLIVNVGSSVGIAGVPGIGVYSATKFALEGMSEALAGEVAEFGIGVLLVEPGAMATRFFEAGTKGAGVEVPLGEAYRGSVVEQVLGLMPGMAESGVDGERAAGELLRVVGKVVEGEGEVGLRMLLGKEGGEGIMAAKQKVGVWQEVVKGFEQGVGRVEA